MKNHTTLRLTIWITCAIIGIICMCTSCKTGYVQCDAYGAIDNQEIDKV